MPEPTHIGFSGTRLGMTEAAKRRLKRLLQTAMVHGGEVWLHHGDCIGSDAEAHTIARSLGMKIAVHPGNIPELRAHCHGDIIYPPKDTLRRNEDIVRETIGLIAASGALKEQRRSGTWQTIRYAKSLRRAHVIIWPDGTTEAHSEHSAR